VKRIAYLVSGIVASSAIGAPALTNDETVAFVCNTTRHAIVISKLTKPMTFRYRAWKLPKATSDKPDVDIVQSGTGDYEGTGPCGHREYEFRSGNVVYSVADAVNCVEGDPPDRAIGQLSVSVNGEVTSQYWCLK
jgi:hypothetical protein